MPSNQITPYSGVPPAAGTPVTFDLMTGRPPGLQQASEQYERAGLDGHAAMTIGTRAEPGVLQTVKYHQKTSTDAAMLAAANAHVAAVEALSGKLCTIYDEWSDSHTTVLVMGVTPAEGNDPRRKVQRLGVDSIRVTFNIAVRRMN